jgi:predicted nuclease with TOPRIM domain
LAHPTRIKTIQNRIEDYKTDKQLLQSIVESLKIDQKKLQSRIEELNSRIEDLKGDRQSLQSKIIRLRNEHSKKIEEVRASVTFRVGEALVGAVRPSKATIALPFKLWRIYRGYKSRERHHQQIQ